MPVVTIQMWAGQSVENKRRMAAGVTAVLAPFMNGRPEAITVIFHEIPIESWAQGGVLSADRADLQERLGRGEPPSGHAVP